MDFRYLIDLCEAAYDSKITALIRQYPDQTNAINWAKNLKKQDRVVWYLNTLEQYLKNPEVGVFDNRTIAAFQEDLLHFLGQENIATIQNYQFRTQSAEQVSQDFSRLEQEFLAKQKRETQPPGRYDLKQGDVELLKFKDGTRWVKLNAAYCNQEGASGAHCGNIVGQHKPNQRILSLRTPTDQVILTFILEPDNTLGEMKARFNQKPSERYHTQIMELLLQNYIKGISGGGYLADQNFSVFDLNEAYLKILQKKKPDLIRTQIQVTPVEILQAPEWIRNNPNYAKLAINQLPQLKKLLGDSSIENWEEAIKDNKDLILYAPDELPNYRERLLQYLVDKTPETLLKTRKKYRTDFNFLKDLLSLNGKYIQAVSTNQRGYQELANIAVKQYGRALGDVPEELQTPEICLAAVKQDGVVLTYVPEKLQTPELYLAAVNQNGYALAYVPEKLRTLELCLAAVKQDGRALDYVPKELRTPEIMLAAVKQNGKALDYVPYEFRTPKICLAAVNQNGRALAYVPGKLRTPKICLVAVKQYGGALGYVPEKLRTPEICLAAVKQYGGALDYVPEELLTPEMCLAAVNQNGEALDYVPEELLTPEMCLAAVKQYGRALDYVPIELKTPEMCLAAVKQQGVALKYVPEKLRTPEICLAAVKQNGGGLRYVPAKLKAQVRKKLKSVDESLQRIRQLAGL